MPVDDARDLDSEGLVFGLATSSSKVQAALAAKRKELAAMAGEGPGGAAGSPGRRGGSAGAGVCINFKLALWLCHAYPVVTPDSAVGSGCSSCFCTLNTIV